MQVEYWPISRIKRFSNPPAISDETIASAVQAIQQAGGMQAPIIVDTADVIVRGRVRYEAALRLGLTDVPVAVVPDPTTDPWADIRRYDHQIPESTDWESEWKLIHLEDLRGIDFYLSNMGVGNGMPDANRNEGEVQPQPQQGQHMS